MNLSISFKAEIVENTAITPDIFKLTLRPLDSFSEPLPGQFFMLSVSESHDPLLKRPFSIFNFKDRELQFLYRIRGRGTRLLSEKKQGQRISLTGPFGKSYPQPDKSTQEVWIVTGGLGIASLNFMINRLTGEGQRLKVLYGARTGPELRILEDIRVKEILIATEDGTEGFTGTVLDLFNSYSMNLQPSSLIYACGPQAVLSFIDQKAQERGIKAYLSLEERMACGFGVCLGCVIKTKEGYKRVCKEGPVFREGEVIW